MSCCLALFFPFLSFSFLFFSSLLFRGSIRRLTRRTSTDGGGGSSSSPDAPLQLRAAEQASLYLRAQRTYLALLERYNPAADMGEDERVRRTARRVGMELPRKEEEEDGKKEGI